MSGQTVWSSKFRFKRCLFKSAAHAFFAKMASIPRTVLVLPVMFFCYQPLHCYAERSDLLESHTETKSAYRAPWFGLMMNRSPVDMFKHFSQFCSGCVIGRRWYEDCKKKKKKENRLFPRESGWWRTSSRGLTRIKKLLFFLWWI